jgi:putative ABC transport system permease protein
MESLLQDLRYCVRLLLKRPSFTFSIILILALGIGANSAIFSVVNSVLFRSLPFEEPEKLIVLDNAPLQLNREARISPTTLLDWKDQVHSFERLASFNPGNNGVNITGGGEPERVIATEISPGFFDTLGIRTLIGRTILPEDIEPGKNNVVIISYGIWKRRFGGDPEILGKTLSLNGKAHTVIGITPSGFEFPEGVELWLPVSFGAGRLLGPVMAFKVIGRLNRDITQAQAQTEMNAFSDRLEREFPFKDQRIKSVRGIKVVNLLDQLIGKIRPTLLTLFGAVGVVLLIACANVANLLLSRVSSRQKELVIRTALGAGRWRLIRQLLVESTLLALLGGTLGLLLALWSVDILVKLGPENLPRLKEVSIDGRVFGFTLGVSLFTGFLFGLLPAIKASKIDLNEALKQGSQKATAGRGERFVGNFLVTSEIALALVLLIGAGLLVKSFVKLLEVDPGYNPQNVLTLAISLPNSKYRDSNSTTEFYQQAIERVEKLPGVESVGATSSLPLGSGMFFLNPFEIEGYSPEQYKDEPLASLTTTSTDYFQTMEITLLTGRHFTEQDSKQAPQVVIINQTMARTQWPNENPIGKRLILVGSDKPREIVGVVEDIKQDGLESASSLNHIYLPYQQGIWPVNTLVLRTSSDPLNLAAAVRTEVQALDNDLPLYDIKTMQQRLTKSVAQRRFTLVLLSAFAAIAMILATVGIYGLIAYSVSQRTREIGIRIALGAQQTDIMKMVLLKGLLLTLLGIAAGIAFAFVMTRLISSLLFGVSSTDPLTFMVVSLLLLIVALFACYIPARRATKVDPMVALRYE